MKNISQSWWRTPVLNQCDQFWADLDQPAEDVQWWQNAVIYQISPWSFLDTNGDGTGDLNGIIEKLDYIVSLGVDAIWLTPIYESPMDDLGYDITDLREVGDQFGTMEDLQRLIAIANGMKLKVIVDQVWNHTSDQHPWFQESSASRDNARADWYVWADPKPDGSPPNNWLSSFSGGCAWKWHPPREQYYLFNFLESQPDLNWHNDDVVEAILKRAKFWLDLGVDGLRVDAVNYFLHDLQLRDNPPRPEGAPLPDSVSAENPLSSQLLIHSFNQPETLERIKPIRELVNQYPNVVTLGEITLCEDSVDLASQFTAGSDRLHMAYHSGLLVDQPMTANLMHDLLQKVVDCFGDGTTCWIVGNHDYGRLRCRWTEKDINGNPYPDEFYHMMAAVLVALPGAFCLWQGDELGLPVAEIPGDISPEQIRDPFGQAFYPKMVGRDGSRTPMPWRSDNPCGGFTSAEKPWLPIPESHLARSVKKQHHDPHSLLNTWRRLLHWRKHQPALEAGRLSYSETQKTILAFSRSYDSHHLLCLFNIGDKPAYYDLADYLPYKAIGSLGFDFELSDDKIRLPPYGAFFAQLKSAP